MEFVCGNCGGGEDMARSVEVETVEGGRLLVCRHCADTVAEFHQPKVTDTEGEGETVKPF